MPHRARAVPLALGLALAALGALAAPADDTLEASLQTLPGEIDHVSSVGRWRTADGGGFYRVIVARGGWEHVAHRLYVQWMRDGDSEHPPRVVTTTSVIEINDAGPFTFSHTVHPKATNRLRITVNARHGPTDQRRQFIVVATAPGVYTVNADGTPP